MGFWNGSIRYLNSAGWRIIADASIIAMSVESHQEKRRDPIGFFIPSLFFTTLFCVVAGYSQGFMGLIPLESTCDDVRRIFHVDTCTYPQSTYFLKEYWVTVDFTVEKPDPSAKLCFRVPRGRVESFAVSFNKRFPLEQFEYKLKYVRGPYGDIGTTEYENKELGIRAYVLDGEISSVVFEPTASQSEELGFQCEYPSKSKKQISPVKHRNVSRKSSRK